MYKLTQAREKKVAKAPRPDFVVVAAEQEINSWKVTVYQRIEEDNRCLYKVKVETREFGDSVIDMLLDHRMSLARSIAQIMDQITQHQMEQAVMQQIAWVHSGRRLS